MKFKISWCDWSENLPGGGREIIIGWVDIISRLESFREGKGSMSLELLNGPDPGPIRVSVIAESKCYLVTVLEAADDDTYVRCYFNPLSIAERVEVLGDYWDARMLTSDFDMVCIVFKAFFESGDVSRELLN